MIFREANMCDIEHLHSIRMSVKENVLSNPNLISADDYRKFITTQGKGWICEVDKQIVGFSIVDAKQHNVWALFIKPSFEGKGIGKKLHDLMIDWYFKNHDENIWLSTSSGTRAEKFYKRSGWKETGTLKNGEIRFELTCYDWKIKKL